MRFSETAGNREVLAALAGMVDSGRIPHAIMLHEDDGGGAIGIAIAFLQYLCCQSPRDGDSCGECPACNKISKLIHPDVHFIFPTVSPNTSTGCIAAWRELVRTNPFFTETELSEALGMEGKSAIISVGESKALLDTLSLSALEGGYRSVVIYLPEKMNQEAANRLLKMIEEPPALTQFLLITHSPEKVLVTISSRCQRIRVVSGTPVRAVSGELADTCSDLFSRLMDALTSRDLTGAIAVGEEAASLPSRESAKAFCKFAADRLRCIFIIQQGFDALKNDDDPQLSAWAAKCRKTFPRVASGHLDRALSLIDRNVNLKILFTDLVDRLYMTI